MELIHLPKITEHSLCARHSAHRKDTDHKAPTTPQNQGLKLDLYKTYSSALKRDAQMVKTGKPEFSSFILEFHVLQIKTNGPLNVSRAVCHTMTPRV